MRHQRAAIRGWRRSRPSWRLGPVAPGRKRRTDGVERHHGVQVAQEPRHGKSGAVLGEDHAGGQIDAGVHHDPVGLNQDHDVTVVGFSGDGIVVVQQSLFDEVDARESFVRSLFQEIERRPVAVMSGIFGLVGG